MLQDPIGSYGLGRMKHMEAVRLAEQERSLRPPDVSRPWRRQAAAMLRAAADRLDANGGACESADGTF